MQHEVCPIADYHKPWHVIRAVYEITHLQITQPTDEGIASKMIPSLAVSCCDLCSRLLRMCPHPAWVTALLSKAGFSAGFDLCSSHCITPVPPSPSFTGATVLGPLLQASETSRGITEEPVVLGTTKQFCCDS